MEMLKTYKKHVRPTLLPDHKESLYINSNGQRINSQTNDLERIKKYDRKLSESNTEFKKKKIVTTLSKNFMPHDQQKILHGMLTHSEDTANLLNICNEKLWRNISTYINKSQGLKGNVSQKDKQALLDLYNELDRTKTAIESCKSMETVPQEEHRQSSVPSEHSDTAASVALEASGSSSSVSDPASKKTDLELLKTKIGIVSMDSPTPSRTDFEKYLKALGIKATHKDQLYKSLCSYMQYTRNRCHAEEVFTALRCLQNPEKFLGAVDTFLKEKNWYNVKTAKEAIERLRKFHNSKSLIFSDRFILHCLDVLFSL